MRGLEPDLQGCEPVGDSSLCSDLFCLFFSLSDRRQFYFLNVLVLDGILNALSFHSVETK